MRIFLSVQQALRRHDVPSYSFWEYYFKQSLAEAGHEIVETPGVDWAEGLTLLTPDARKSWLDNAWGRTVDHLRTEHARRPVDFFLGYLFPDQVEPQAVHSIRSLGIPCVNFFCDNVREFTGVPATFHAFDLHWVPEAGARSLYSRAGLRFLYAPMPVWIPQNLRTLPGAENSGTVFIGSHDTLRADLLARAASAGLDFQIHGAGWMPEDRAEPFKKQNTYLKNQWNFFKRHGLLGLLMRATYQMHQPVSHHILADRVGRPLSGENYFKTLRESKIVLGINRYLGFRHPYSNPGRYSRLRDIEAPMLGACYLTEDAPGLDDLFEPGVEIEIYRDPGELLEKARHLGADAVRREKMRSAGQRRALAEHTVARSIEKIRRELGI